jgi:hypothetical protein
MVVANGQEVEARLDKVVDITLWRTEEEGILRITHIAVLATPIEQQTLKVSDSKVGTYEILLYIVKEVCTIVHRELRGIIGIVDTQDHIANAGYHHLTLKTLLRPEH